MKGIYNGIRSNEKIDSVIIQSSNDQCTSLSFIKRSLQQMTSIVKCMK